MSNRKLLARILANAGHCCEMAENGKVGLHMLLESIESNAPFDAVLMDFEMQVMNGPEAAKCIRAAGSDVYIVGVTGNVLPEDVHKFVSCGANAVLPKPIKLADLESLWMESGTLNCARTK
jgi:CheY-like chemotaxis protein